MTTTAGTYHVPVLLKESVDGLAIQPDGIYVDVTFGGGGHTREILQRLGPKGRLFSFDQDADAENNITSLLSPLGGRIGSGKSFPQGETGEGPHFTFVRSNFRYLTNWMRYYGVDHIDGLLADLGVSSHHFDDATRGFSFRFDATLDMRMNKRAGQTAADIVNDYEEERLADILRLYGEVKQAHRLAKSIAIARRQQRIETTGDLQKVLGLDIKKDLARVFQALRIEVNHEMEALRDMLLGATKLLGEGGRLSVITYHSLEDRIVKNVMRSGNPEGYMEKDFYGRTQSPLYAVGKIVTPSVEEQQRNPRSRSAKLRVAEKVSCNK